MSDGEEPRQEPPSQEPPPARPSDLRELITWLEQTWERQAEILGPHYPTVLDVRHELATAYLDTGRFEEAIALFESNLEDRRRYDWKRYSPCIDAANGLAAAYLVVGRTTRALVMVRLSLHRCRAEHLRENHPTMLGTRSLQGLGCLATGRPRKAAKLLRRTLEGRLETLGEEHPDTLAAVDGLARALLKVRGRGRGLARGEAFHRLQNSVDREAAVLGADHPRTLSTAGDLGLAFTEDGRLWGPALLDKTFETQRTSWGADHRGTLATARKVALGHLAFADSTVASRYAGFDREYADKSRAKGFELLRETVVRARDTLGPRDVLTRSLKRTRLLERGPRRPARWISRTVRRRRRPATPAPGRSGPGS